MTAATAARQDPIASFEGIAKTYPNGVHALGPLSFHLREGEFLSFLGPSGCGKTTLLRLIAGLETPSTGRISWHGRTRPRATGYVFQEPALMPWADIAANVAVPLRLLGVSANERATRVEEALSLAGLSDFAHAFPKELSGGMRMRASLARALAPRPSLLLMDEPFAALDEITRFRLNDELRGLWQRLGCTIVFVTHSVFETAYLATRTLVLSGRPGTIAAEIELGTAAPRGPHYRASADYAARCGEISDALSRAMEPRP
jgi:NitT/TauT family transport system ATP-binding protein